MRWIGTLLMIVIPVAATVTGAHPSFDDAYPRVATLDLPAAYRILSLEFGSTEIYAFDQAEMRIKVYSRQGTLLRSFGRVGQGPGEYLSPTCLALTPAGEVMVGEATQPVILVLAPDGTFRRRIMLDGRGGVFGIGRIGDRLCLARRDYRPEGGSTLLELVFAQGKIVRNFLSLELKPEGRRTLEGMAHQNPFTIDPAGRIYATPGVVYRLQQFDREGRLVRTFPIPESYVSPQKVGIPASFGGMEDIRAWIRTWHRPVIVVISAGRIHVQREIYQSLAYALDVYTPDGRLLQEDIQTDQPLLGVDPDGRLVFTEESDDGTRLVFRRWGGK